MATIQHGDNLFATAYMRGVEIFNYTGTEFTSISQLLGHVRRSTRLSGMVTINVRNSSQGWSAIHSVYMA